MLDFRWPVSKIPYPQYADCSIHHDGFEFPRGFVKELKKNFPDWKRLHEALDMNDQGQVWGLLDKYQERLSNITLPQIIKAAEGHNLDYVVDQAKAAVKFKAWRKRLEPRFFPEWVKVRKERLASQSSSY